MVKADPATIKKLTTALSFDSDMLFTKCGYTKIPEGVIAIARKTGDLSKDQQERLHPIFNSTIDEFLKKEDD